VLAMMRIIAGVCTAPRAAFARYTVARSSTHDKAPAETGASGGKGLADQRCHRGRARGAGERRPLRQRQRGKYHNPKTHHGHCDRIKRAQIEHGSPRLLNADRRCWRRLWYASLF